MYIFWCVEGMWSDWVYEWSVRTCVIIRMNVRRKWKCFARLFFATSSGFLFFNVPWCSWVDWLLMKDYISRPMNEYFIAHIIWMSISLLILFGWVFFIAHLKEGVKHYVGLRLLCWSVYHSHCVVWVWYCHGAICWWGIQLLLLRAVCWWVIQLLAYSFLLMVNSSRSSPRGLLMVNPAASPCPDLCQWWWGWVFLLGSSTLWIFKKFGVFFW